MPQWFRKCQECGHRQRDKRPPVKQTEYDHWAEHICKKCKSASLDYGNERNSESLGTIAKED